MRTLRPLALLAMLSALGCATSPAPVVIDTGVEAPNSWSNHATSEGSIELEWWKSFGDSKLDALVAEAFAHNPSLDAAAARIERALAQAEIAGADVYPHLNGSFSAARQKSVFNFGGGSQSAHTSSYGASLSVSWEADIWGRIRAGHEAAFADIDAANAAFDGAALSLASQVTKAYFAAVDAKERVAIFKLSLENARSTESSVNRRFEEGTRPLVDVDLTAATRATTEAQLAASERGLDGALRQLETLVGRYPKAAVEIAAKLPVLPAEMVPAGLPAEIVRRRPDLVEAERRYAAQMRRVDEAEANLYPKISLTASAGSSSDELKDLLDGNFSVWSLAANLTAPIFQGGRLRAAIKVNEASAEEIKANYVLSVLRAWQEVELALAADSYLARQSAATRETRDRSASALASAEERYASGLSDILVLLNARGTVYQADANLVGIQRERLDARVSLIAALGGGFDATAIYEVPQDQAAQKRSAAVASNNNNNE